MKIARKYVVFFSVVLSACASTMERDARASCQDPSCAITVTVLSCGDIRATPDPAKVAKGNKAHMLWHLATPGWTFTDNGIDIPNNGGEFDGKLKDSGTTFKWKNKHSKPGSYKYDINVTDGRQVCKRDPTVVNE